ncbi:heme A synthase [Caulobacter sp. CCUG 60055]|uniref:COX15/CtaA family protein n=1 Tax=Caulobacter sp. CCUG 60055 TaxID=2100090 RepID=UPI001FA73542|nr:COX15/CtaA family protein [Caulobacter sp. CCUG 60055]MCI3179010.1 heme A synthase [Caulobacter sp. CCUG 60055]
MTSFLRSDRSRPVAVWLFAVAFLVLAMVVVGGATRLTGSGLSITEWKPISGVIPPLSQEAWAAEFRNYQRIPQFHLVNPDMTVETFKTIFWWEWAHRLLGRLVGFAFAAPFVVFLALRRIPSRLIWRCAALFALGGLQGVVGWWMVASGLVERVTVAPERLTIHLGLALILFCALVWTGLEAWSGKARATAKGPWAPAAAALAVLVYVQSLLGGLVAGNAAGQVYNDWPLMNGALFPVEYAGRGLWGTLAHSQAAVQFNHRLAAYLLFAGALAFTVCAVRSRTAPAAVRSLGALLALLVTLQAGLGIATLMTHVPLALGVAHQFGATLVLAAAMVLAWRSRRI